MGRLEGRVALVTGSGRGFGRSVAVAYAMEGARVVSVARTVLELEQTANMIESRGGEVLTVPTDLSKVEEIHRLRDEVLAAYGRLDILFNNAAASPWKTLEETTVEEWDRVMAINLRAPFVLARAFLDAMRAQGGGSIVNVTSASATRGFFAEVAYCPSKFGLEGLTQCLALELKPFNIAVNSLNVAAPQGRTLKPTGLTEAEAREKPESIKSRYADVDSMVEAFGDAWVFLALQDASGVTGRRLNTGSLAEELRRNGLASTAEKHRGKLTRAVYEPYDFPESVHYQTPGGGWKELKFKK